MSNKLYKDELDALNKKYKLKLKLKKKQENILKKYNKYLSLHTDNLNNQLNELKNVEGNVSTRDALVRINNKNLSDKNKKMHIMRNFILYVLGYVFYLIAYIKNIISLQFFLSSVITITLVIIIHIIWHYNKSFKFVVRKTESELGKLANEIYQEKIKIQNDMNNYTNENCDCPNNNNNNNNNNGANNMIDVLPYHNPNIDNLTKYDGIYYYDGTAPQERIYPSIPNVRKYNIDNYNRKLENGDKFQIEWEVAPDMGSRDNNRYIPMPTNMRKTVGLPKALYDKHTCHKNFNATNKNKHSKYWTVNL